MIYEFSSVVSDYANPPIVADSKYYGCKFDDLANMDLKPEWRESIQHEKENVYLKRFMLVGEPVPDNYMWRVPTKAIYKKGNKHRKFLAEITRIICAYTYGISEKIKNIFEEFDPGMHQHFPIDIIDGKTGEKLEQYGQYYLLNICKSVGAWEVYDIEAMKAEGHFRTIIQEAKANVPNSRKYIRHDFDAHVPYSISKKINDFVAKPLVKDCKK